MKRLLIVANWKSNKTQNQSLSFLEAFADSYRFDENKNIVICPSFTSLYQVSDFLKQKNIDIKVGAQNVSPFDPGAYTGEINSAQVKDFCAYCIIGHSERRNSFAENHKMVSDKIMQLEKEDIIPIVCVSNMSQVEDLSFSKTSVIAYEPIEAIGSGEAASPHAVEEITTQIKEKFPDSLVLYGGSVDSKNISSFTSLSSVDGVLVGSESLDPESFLQIINNA
jgi:triosephosphate isomerase